MLKENFGIIIPLNIELINAGVLKRNHRFIWLRAYSHIEAIKPDVVITRNLGFLNTAFKLRSKIGCRVYFEAHDYFGEDPASLKQNDRKRRKRHAREKSCIPKVDGLICVSQGLADLFARQYPSVSALSAPTGVKTTVSQPKSKLTHRIGYIGTISDENYDHELLFATLAEMKTENVKLVIAGINSQDQRKRMETLARKYNVAQRTELLGWLAPSAVDELKQSLDLGLAPMRDNFFHSFSSPLKVMEYLAAGMPIVAPPLSAVSFIKDSECLLLAEPTPQAWAKKIDSFYLDEANVARLSQSALKLAETRSWDKRAAQILRFIRTEK